MDEETRARLEAAGFRIGDAGDFLEMTEAERRTLDEIAAPPKPPLAQLEALPGPPPSWRDEDMEGLW